MEMRQGRVALSWVSGDEGGVSIICMPAMPVLVPQLLGLDYWPYSSRHGTVLEDLSGAVAEGASDLDPVVDQCKAIAYPLVRDAMAGRCLLGILTLVCEWLEFVLCLNLQRYSTGVS
jgi:hypothetical protein